MSHWIIFLIDGTNQKFNKNITNICKWLQICHQSIKSNVEFDVVYPIKTPFEEIIIKKE